MASAATAPLRIPAFRNLWAASIVSNVGSFLQTVAASWAMLELTGSAFWVGLVVASATLPLLLVALPAGAIADLMDRRRILLVAQTVMALSAAVTAVLAWTGHLTPYNLLALGLLLGVGQAFTLPSWQAMVPDLVPTEFLAGAVALNSIAFNVARAVGPALGGILVATGGAALAFGLNAVSFIGIIVAVALFPRAEQNRDVESLFDAIANGLRYARFTASYRWLLVVAVVFGIASGGVQAMLPTFTATELGGGAATYGLLLGAMGAGAVLGAASRASAATRLAGRLVPLAIVVWGACGITLVAAGTLTVALAAMALSGVAWVWALATLNATTQMLSPRWVRGRIMSLYTLAFVGFLPLGSIAAGAVGDRLGIGAALAGFAALAAALGLVASRLPLPVLEEIRTPGPPSDYRPSQHPERIQADRVMVVNTWVIDEADLDPFLAAMEQLRLVRLRTGAFRWRLYRDVTDPHRMTEVFLLRSWEEHLRQHRRVDADGAEVIKRAFTFDRTGGVRNTHLASIGLGDAERPSWAALADHEELHRTEEIPVQAPAQSASRPAS